MFPTEWPSGVPLTLLATSKNPKWFIWWYGRIISRMQCHFPMQLSSVMNNSASNWKITQIMEIFTARKHVPKNVGRDTNLSMQRTFPLGIFVDAMYHGINNWRNASPAISCLFLGRHTPRRSRREVWFLALCHGHVLLGTSQKASIACPIFQILSEWSAWSLRQGFLSLNFTFVENVTDEVLHLGDRRISKIPRCRSLLNKRKRVSAVKSIVSCDERHRILSLTST